MLGIKDALFSDAEVQECNSLAEELESLQSTFEKLQQKTMERLEEEGVGIKQFKRAISSFAPNVQLKSFTSFKKVSGSVGVEDVFSIWNQDVMWSFLDFTLLERLVMKYGSTEMKNSMRQYSNWVEDFRQRTMVSKLMEMWKVPNLPEEYEKCKKIIVDLNIRADECTLARLEHLRRHSCNKLLKGIPLSEAALVLFQLTPGCIILTWIVWADVIQKMKESLLQCINDGEYFKENSIITMVIDGETFMSMETVSYNHSIVP